MTDSGLLQIAVGASICVSGILSIPSGAKACFVVAHGAGAGMRHPFMEKLSTDLAARGVGTLRYQFPYMDKGGKRPDPPALCHATVRAAVAAAHTAAPGLALIAGGKSFGGRMSSQAQAQSPLPQVSGLAFLGFPLHPPKQPSDTRAEHLAGVHIPMLFIRGTRDEFAEAQLLAPLIERLGGLATLCSLPQADHSFRAPARSGHSAAQINELMLDALVGWITAVTGS